MTVTLNVIEELSKYIWQLKRNNKIPSIEWKIVRKEICDARAITVFCV